MSLAKAVLSGTVLKEVETRYTENNVPVTDFKLIIDEREQSTINVVVRGKLGETMEKGVSTGDKIVVEGRLQMTNVKAKDGTERKIMELDASSFEMLKSSQPTFSGIEEIQKEVVKVPEIEANDVLINDEEIPF